MGFDRPAALEAAAFLNDRMSIPPRVGILTGTGLGESAGAMDIDRVIDYADIPNFPVSTVQGHAGKMALGTISGTPTIALQGRFHLYEGYPPKAVTFPIRVMQELGVTVLMLTNAAGGLNPGFAAGDIMVISDHVNLTGANPLMGPNEDAWGIRFPDMTRVYDPDLSTAARQAAAESEIPVRSGVYAGLKGPSLETPAEIRFLKTIGCDAVGLSTIMEAIAGVHAGMHILGLSVITNINDPDRPVPATLDAIIAVANRAAPGLDAIIRGVVGNLSSPAVNTPSST